MNINTNTTMNDSNEIRRFQCDKCNKYSLVLKKVWDQQHHGFACDACWTIIQNQTQTQTQTQTRYKRCTVQ